MADEKTCPDCRVEQYCGHCGTLKANMDTYCAHCGWDDRVSRWRVVPCPRHAAQDETIRLLTEALESIINTVERIPKPAGLNVGLETARAALARAKGEK